MVDKESCLLEEYVGKLERNASFKKNRKCFRHLKERPIRFYTDDKIHRSPQSTPASDLRLLGCLGITNLDEARSLPLS